MLTYNSYIVDNWRVIGSTLEHGQYQFRTLFLVNWPRMLPSHQLHQLDNLTPWLSITPGEEFCYRCDTSSSFTTSVILGTTLYNMIFILVHIFPQFCFKKFAANLFSCINLSYICVGCFWSKVVGRFARLYFLLIYLLILADFCFWMNNIVLLIHWRLTFCQVVWTYWMFYYLWLLCFVVIFWH